MILIKLVQYTLQLQPQQRHSPAASVQFRAALKRSYDRSQIQTPPLQEKKNTDFHQLADFL